MRYFPPAKKCKLDSPWLGPYLIVSLARWAIGVQQHPDSPILLAHCQDLKKIPRPRGLVSWLPSDRTEHLIGASTAGRSTPGSAISTVSGLLLQPSLLHSSHAPDASVPVLPPMGSICVDYTRFLAIALMLGRFAWPPLFMPSTIESLCCRMGRNRHYGPAIPEKQSVGFWIMFRYHGINRWR